MKGIENKKCEKDYKMAHGCPTQQDYHLCKGCK